MIVETLPLPVYRRSTPTFPSLFGIDAGPVLTAMNDADDDVVNQRPRVPVGLRRVGFTRMSVPVRIDDPFGSGTQVTAQCRIAIGCPVPADRRGLHMSRLGDVLARSVMSAHRDLGTFARTLAEQLGGVEYGGAVSVRVHAVIPYLEQVGPESGRGKLSLEHLTLLANARLADGRGGPARSEYGLEFTHMVACPCVQKTYAHARDGARDALPPGERGRPLMTHSQRCVTRVLACGIRDPFQVPDLLSRLDRVVVRTANTLPRDMELAVVYRAHQQPQFVEDALRETLWAMYRTLAEPRTFTRIRGRSRSQESIHDFDLSAWGVLTPERVAEVTTAPETESAP